MDGLPMKKFQPLNQVQNRDIVDPSGEHVGQIHDLLLDIREGKIEYVCIALPPGAGLRGREVVVPWSALRLQSDGMRWEVAARKRILTSIAQPAPHRSSRSGRDPS
jgi:sporulation protein YlmC with PRC-barrel domain